MNLKRLFLYPLLVSVALSAVIGIGVVLFGDFGSFEVRVLMTTLTVTATSILGLACGAFFETGRGRLLPMAGIVITVIAAVMTLLIIWDVGDDSTVFVKAASTAMLLAVSCSHLSLLSLARLDRRFAWTLTAAHICVWTLTAIILYLMWFEPQSDSDTVTRIIAVLSILIASVTVATPVLHKLSRTDRTLEQIDAEIDELEARIDRLRQEKVRMENNDNT
ncbi:MAG: hypothetical protein KF855_06080 [Acidobacteria bacterium]|nr:hypothetical protein [Acidobacteriota bacterium]